MKNLTNFQKTSAADASKYICMRGKAKHIPHQINWQQKTLKQSMQKYIVTTGDSDFEKILILQPCFLMLFAADAPKCICMLDRMINLVWLL